MAKKNLFDPNPSGFIEHDHNNDGLDRRGFLKCMAWAGTGALCVMHGDVLNDDGATFRERYAKNSKGQGWYSFDKNGVHFVGLVNAMNLKVGGLGTLGHDQLEWLEHDVKQLKSSTPIVVFAHIPLWTAY